MRKTGGYLVYNDCKRRGGRVLSVEVSRRQTGSVCVGASWSPVHL